MRILSQNLLKPLQNTLLGFGASLVTQMVAEAANPTSVPYSEAVTKLGEEFDEAVETHDICDIYNRWNLWNLERNYYETYFSG